MPQGSEKTNDQAGARFYGSLSPFLSSISLSLSLSLTHTHTHTHTLSLSLSLCVFLFIAPVMWRSRLLGRDFPSRSVEIDRPDDESVTNETQCGMHREERNGSRKRQADVCPMLLHFLPSSSSFSFSSSSVRSERSRRRSSLLSSTLRVSFGRCRPRFRVLVSRRAGHL